MFAAEWGVGEVLWSLLWFFLFVMWLWLVIVVFGDIFRSRDMGGWAKAAWTVFVIFLPFIGVLSYLIARGHRISQHAVEDAKAQEDAFRQYVKGVVGNGHSSADEIAKLADLRSKGVISDSEFEQGKARLLA